MVIEWLKFRVAAQLREEFIIQDEAIWTTMLAQYPGFLGKEIWLNPQQAEEVVIVIRWQTREQWFAIPQADLELTEQKFNQALGGNYDMVESKEYQVRKFPHTDF